MENFKPGEFRDNLAHLLKSIPEHQERGYVLDSVRETGAYDMAEKKEKAPALKLISSFEILDQSGKLDFDKYLGKKLLGGKYWPSNRISKEELGTSKLVSGMKGGKYGVFVTTRYEESGKISAELGDEPLTLDEWRYLFSQLTEKQLLGSVMFYVRFEDGKTRAIHTLFDDKDGPGQYSIDLEDIESIGGVDYVDEGEKIIARKGD
jgi:hypothetical protein